MNHYKCLDTCVANKNNITLKNIFNNASVGILAETDHQLLKYCPVGNNPKEPIVIIVGKTADKDTAQSFINDVSKTKDIALSGFRYVYSNENMRNNLFGYLLKINLFDYLKTVNTYWQNGEYNDLWKKLFYDQTSSGKCGIQLTQACNCAIINKKYDKNGNIKYNSNAPDKKTIDNVITSKTPDCLFNSLNITDKTKLIIFLDTPFTEGKFHQINLFKKSELYKKCTDNGIKVISITHPSGQNSDIFKELDNLEEKSLDQQLKLNQRTRYSNANILLNTAIETIKNLE